MFSNSLFLKAQSLRRRFVLRRGSANTTLTWCNYIEASSAIKFILNGVSLWQNQERFQVLPFDTRYIIKLEVNGKNMYVFTQNGNTISNLGSNRKILNRKIACHKSLSSSQYNSTSRNMHCHKSSSSKLKTNVSVKIYIHFVLTWSKKVVLFKRFV